MKGGYVLIIKIPRRLSLFLKSIGSITVDPGIWVYIGSAMGHGSTNLENRIRRHFRKEKKVHWHIDHLLASKVQLLAAIWAESQKPIECDIVQALEKQKEFTNGPRKFGASDCVRGCFTHLFQTRDKINVESVVIKVFKQLELSPKITHEADI